MNNRKQNKQPLFAEVDLTGDEFQKSPSITKDEDLCYLVVTVTSYLNIFF